MNKSRPLERTACAEWVCTDPDCLQYCRKTTNLSWDFIECRKYPDDRYVVCRSHIKLDEYTASEIAHYISAFYSSIDELVTYYGSEDSPQICAECIFEQMNLGQMEICAEKGSFEEAKSFVEDYIEYN